jgi:hypothetical protein
MNMKYIFNVDAGAAGLYNRPERREESSMDIKVVPVDKPEDMNFIRRIGYKF